MSKNTSFSLGDHFSSFVDDQVGSGRYQSASDVIRTSLRLLEDYESRVEALRQDLVAGERSGQPEPFDFKAFVDRMEAGQGSTARS